MTLKERYQSVKERITQAAQRAGRSPNEIILVAVTKYASIDQVRELIELGHEDLGESQVQNLVQRAAQIEEYLQRIKELGGGGRAPVRTDARGAPRPVRWHMIGHLQRNKVRKVISIARLIHSVDSLRLAEEIQVAAAKLDKPLEVLVQVNVAGEKSKFGIAPAAARHFIDQMDTMINIRVRGLMCMAPLSEDPHNSRLVFERGRELFEEIRRIGSGGERFDILSMGMSADFEAAIECGANLVRVGSAIFGESAETADETQD